MSTLLKAGTLSTDVRANGSSKLSVEIFVADALTGQGKTGLTKASFTKFGLSLAGGAVVDYTSTMVDLSTIGDAYTSKGFKEKDATKDPGVYRFDLPVADAANVGYGRLTWNGSGILDSGDSLSTEITFVNYDPDVVNPDISAIKGKTDTIPAAGPPDAAVYTNTRGAKLDQLDAAMSSRAATGAAMSLTSGERTAIANALLDLSDAVEVGATVRQALRVIAAEAAGNGSGFDTATGVYKGIGVATTRITSTMTGSGNRTNTLSP